MTRAPALGPRGEGWVAAQATLLAAVGIAGLGGPRWPPGWRPVLRAAAVPLAAGASVLGLGGSLHLGSRISPFPRPVEGAELRQDGLYRLVRHPIYGGVLLANLAWSLATSPLALAPAVLLAPLLDGKRRREEAWLQERHPDYADYRRRVRWRFVPLVW